ncbi:uncharacterized protein LOC123304889 [Chrysoperla carnea]|uniref:uncharacterized protein LOC123304889 n=1 Tax=Chrysoperla carnea TaxID=189513 RepID=UPI001D065B6D|nr:uncharacterized protein LOC123304889 [Chrysoperla carnea]
MTSSYNFQEKKRLGNLLIELERKIINKENEFQNTSKRCEAERNNYELKYNDLLVKQKKLSESGDIQNQLKIENQYRDELKTLMRNIEEKENVLKKLENEKKKLNEQDKSYFVEKSKIAKEITGIKWNQQTKQIQGLIKNSKNSYLKFFSIKNDGNSYVTEKLYKEIQKSATKWDDFVNEA